MEILSWVGVLLALSFGGVVPRRALEPAVRDQMRHPREVAESGSRVYVNPSTPQISRGFSTPFTRVGGRS